MLIKSLLLLLLIAIFFTASLQARSEWLGKDKAMHFMTSAFLTYWNYGFSNDILNQSENNSYLYSISLTTFLGFSKEFSDKHIKKTRWSWHDMAYNGAGIVFGIILIKNLR
ncbi:MAG: hypothetical protein K0B81_08795 [Candidatus Cloacimonetes bacterium]|nr:hypothetical protein [Candidatus Cloacimonadota bacterium]